MFFQELLIRFLKADAPAAQALVDEVLLRLFLVTAVVWVLARWSRVPLPEAEVVPWAAESFEAVDETTIVATLNDGMTFHDGRPVTAEDVKFSFERYKGASAQLMKDRVAAIETGRPRSCRSIGDRNSCAGSPRSVVRSPTPRLWTK